MGMMGISKRSGGNIRLFSLAFSIAVHAVFLIIVAVNIKGTVVSEPKHETAPIRLVNIQEYSPPPVLKPEVARKPIVKVEKENIVKKEEIVDFTITENVVETEQTTEDVPVIEEIQAEDAKGSVSGGETAGEDTGDRAGSAQAAADAAAYIKENFNYIQRRIKNNLVYPSQARRTGIQGTVELLFTIEYDGQVNSMSVYKSSGQAVLDQAALEALSRSAPFRPPKNRVKIIIPVTFTLR
jgi:protein TonB